MSRITYIHNPGKIQKRFAPAFKRVLIQGIANEVPSEIIVKRKKVQTSTGEILRRKNFYFSDFNFTGDWKDVKKKMISMIGVASAHPYQARGLNSSYRFLVINKERLPHSLQILPDKTHPGPAAYFDVEEGHKVRIPVDGKNVQLIEITSEEYKKKCKKPFSKRQRNRVLKDDPLLKEQFELYKNDESRVGDFVRHIINECISGDLAEKRFEALLAKKIWLATKKFD